MKLLLVLCGTLLIAQSRAASATLEKFLPWMAPNALAIGTSVADFKKDHPQALDFAESERKPDVPFKGDLTEALPDGSFINYVFVEDKLEGLAWSTPASPKTAEMVAAVRKSLLQTCGEPTSGTTGRIKAHGGVARIVWEEYRPTIDKNYLITLKATSESGMEVMLINETEAKKRGIKITPRTYEEVAQDAPPAAQSDKQASELVDLLAAARVEAQPSKSMEAGTPDQGKGDALQSKTSPLGESNLGNSSVTPTKQEQYSSTSWSWWSAGLSLVVLVLIATVLRKRR